MSWPWWAGALFSAPYLAAPAGMLLGGKPKPRLADFQPLTDPGAPFVSVILPARNEASNIAACVASLSASSYPRFEVIVVDDRSSDGTGDLARQIAAHDPRVRVMAGADLPQGWFGKTWACWQGYKAAIGDVLLFTDADTRHGPALLGRAVAALKAKHADFVSLLQKQEMKTFWERLVQPLFLGAGGLMINLRGGLAGANRNTNPTWAAANGQFILVTRSSYEVVGGHQAIKGTVVEDLMLARAYIKAGRPHFLAYALEDMSTRMYDSLGAIVEGWSKNIFMALVESTASLGRAYRFALLFLLLPLSLLLPAVALGVGLATGSAALATFGALGYAGLSAAAALILWVVGEPAWYALLHPLGALMQTFIFLKAMWRGPGKIQWRGRTYTHGIGKRLSQ